MDKKTRRRLFAVLMPHVSGKSTFCDAQDASHSSRTVYIDVDRLVNSDDQIKRSSLIKCTGPTRDTWLFPLLRAKINEVLRLYATQNVIIVTSNKLFIAYLGIKTKRTLIMVPDTHLWASVKSGLSSTETDLLSFDKVRDSIIKGAMDTKGAQLKYYSDFSELTVMIRAFASPC
jgi:hypothetical protein